MIEYIPKKASGFTNIAQEAFKKAIEEKQTVFFMFSEIRVEVNNETKFGLLTRDFTNALIMGWAKIGPDCVERYDDETQKLIDDKNNELK